jgi:hypothetical protein
VVQDGEVGFKYVVNLLVPVLFFSPGLGFYSLVTVMDVVQINLRDGFYLGAHLLGYR